MRTEDVTQPARRIVVEVDLETRRRLKMVAAKRDLTIKGLIAMLAERADDCLDLRNVRPAPEP